MRIIFFILVFALIGNGAMADQLSCYWGNKRGHGKSVSLDNVITGQRVTLKFEQQLPDGVHTKYSVTAKQGTKEIFQETYYTDQVYSYAGLNFGCSLILEQDLQEPVQEQTNY